MLVGYGLLFCACPIILLRQRILDQLEELYAELGDMAGAEWTRDRKDAESFLRDL